MNENKLKAITSKLFPKGLYLTLKSLYRGSYLADRRIRRAVSLMNRHHPEAQLRVLDVGARHGLGAFGMAELAELKNLHLEGVEPDAAEARLLETEHHYGPYAKVHPVGVLDKQGRQPLYMTQAPGCASVHKPRTEKLRRYAFADWFEPAGEIEIETTTLDALCPSDQNVFDLIKVDVQGAELDVLRGGEQLLRNATAVLLEAHFTELYIGQTLFPEIHNYMTERGFCLVMLREVDRIFDGEVVEANCGYVKNIESIQSREQLVKQLLFSTMCNKSSYGRFLLKQVGAGLMSADEIQRWNAVL